MIKTKKHIISLLITLIVIVVINLISSQVYLRFDLTQAKRYTLSEAAKQNIEIIDAPLIVDV
ncbi:MAG: gliding motility-associated ABC transporter substrate-binding protein GldG, partial [Algicola sp.]|nr:gliding motility-associated ABC transporter substrate-binding protein GldG [Algicola sp.]